LDPLTNDAGLDEYMQWCEDMDMEPVLTVWDGKSYGGIIRAGEMQPYLDDILDELEVSTCTQITFPDS
jgi:alpha-N-arabinofuranosidase